MEIGRPDGMANWLLAALMAATLLGLSACREEDPRSRQLDDAMRSLANDAQETLESISDELDDAVETGREVARDLGDRAVEVADDAIDAADAAIESAEEALAEEREDG
jgi:hypothetical protein